MRRLALKPNAMPAPRSFRRTLCSGRQPETQDNSADSEQTMDEHIEAND